MRETIAWLEWGEREVFRLSRLEDTHGEAARLTLPGGEVVELRKDDWLQVAVAVNRLFASQPVSLSKREPLDNTGKPWTKALDVDLASRWAEGTQSWQKGPALGELATYFGRTKGAITSRLVKLNLVAATTPRP